MGPINLRENITLYKKTLGAILSLSQLEDDVTDLITYEIPGEDTYIDTENGLVVSVSTYKSCIYRGKEIIGMTQDDLENLLECQPDEIGESVLYDDGDVQTPLEFFELGAQVWVANGIVTNISVLNYEDE